MKKLLDYKKARRFYRFLAQNILSPSNDASRILYNELRRGFKDIPLYIATETTTRCNLDCSYCPQNQIAKRRTQFMSEKIFKDIIRGAAEAFPNYKGQLLPHNYGEPLMDKRIFSLIAFTRRTLPGAEIVFFTNGELLTKNCHDELIDIGVNRFVITQHREQMPQSIRDWFIPSEYPNIRYQVARKDIALFNRGKTVKVDRVARMKFCYLAPYGMTFDTEGNLVACCNDPFSTTIFGNITDGFKYLWYKPDYVEFRRCVRKGDLYLSICKKCSSR